jgi:hypothetical protein
MAYEPAAAKDSPRAYYLFLRSQGLPPLAAVQKVEERFGPPKTDKEKAKDAQMNSLAQMGGNIGGLLLTNEIMRGFPNLGGLFGSGGTTTAGAGTTAAGTVGAGAGTAGAGTTVATPNILGAQMVPMGAPSGWALEGIGSAGNYYLPIAGAIGAGDLLLNQRTGRRGYLQGAASGAAMGSYFGPWGALIGAGVGLGLGGANELLDTNRYKKEGNRFAELRKQGITLPETTVAEGLRQGRSKQQLIDIEKANIAQGKHGNVKFAQSRNEADLTPDDIIGYAAFYEKYGNDWMGKFNDKQRREIAQKALNAGAVNEHHGTIDIDWNKVDGPQTKGPAPITAQGRTSIRDMLDKNMRK